MPVFIAHGEDDKVVDISQSKHLARELEHRGIPCETFFRPFAAHGFADETDRVEFYERVEAFLTKYLKADAK